MLDYIRELGSRLTSDDLIEVFGDISLLNGTPYCKNWVELISAVGVEGMLSICKDLGDKEFRIPTLYEVLVVYSALLVNQYVQKGIPIEEAKQKVIGGIYLDGFDELLRRIRLVADRNPSELD